MYMQTAPLWLWILGIPCLILCFYMEYKHKKSNEPSKGRTKE